MKRNVHTGRLVRARGEKGPPKTMDISNSRDLGPSMRTVHTTIGSWQRPQKRRKENPVPFAEPKCRSRRR